jgi:hypothetical protein
MEMSKMVHQKLIAKLGPSRVLSTVVSALFILVVLPPTIRAQTPASPVKAAAAPKANASDSLTAEPVKVTLERSKVVTSNGRESKVAATTAKPGDVLEEVATYLNRSSGAVRALEATLPVPANTELVMSSLQPGNASASLDGVTFSAVPLKRKVTQPNGVALEQPVPLKEYRFLRWYPGELAAGKSLTFKARFKVVDEAPAAASSTPSK